MGLFSFRKTKKALDKETVLSMLVKNKEGNMDIPEVGFINIYVATISQIDDNAFADLIKYSVKAMVDSELEDSSWYQKFCAYLNLMGIRKPDEYQVLSAVVHADYRFILKNIIEGILN